MSLIKAEDNAHTLFEINQDNQTIATANYIWLEGAQLLATQSDVILCDSMWDCNSEKVFFFADNRSLAKAALSTRENREPWKIPYNNTRAERTPTESSHASHNGTCWKRLQQLQEMSKK